MRDAVAVGLVVVAFAVLSTTHLTIAFGLLRRPPRWRAAVALALVPAAPVLAWREQMRARAIVWGVAAAAYLIGLALSA